MKKLILLSLAALMFFLTSCNDDVTPQKAQSSRVKLHEMSSNALINFEVDIDEDLDEYTMDILEAPYKLSADLQELGLTRLDVNNATIYTINSEDYVPYVASIISHVNWTGSVYADMVTSFVAAGVVSVPSVFYYVFDFPNDSGFAVLSADSRRPISLVHYQEEGEISNLDFDMESCIDMLFDFDGRMHGIDSITLADLHSRVGLSTAFPIDLHVLSCIKEMAHYRESIGGSSISSKSSQNILRTQIVEEENWKNAYPYITNQYQAAHTNIPLAILKILAYEGYVGELCGEFFDGVSLRAGSVASIAYWTELLYDDINHGPTMSLSSNGLYLLSSLGFVFTTPSLIPPATRYYDQWLPATYVMPVYGVDGHPGIVLVDDEHWNLLVGVAHYYSPTDNSCNGYVYIETSKPSNGKYYMTAESTPTDLVTFYEIDLAQAE